VTTKSWVELTDHSHDKELTALVVGGLLAGEEPIQQRDHLACSTDCQELDAELGELYRTWLPLTRGPILELANETFLATFASLLGRPFSFTGRNAVNPARITPMQKRSSGAPLMMVLLLVAPALALSQATQETRTLIVNGQSGQVTVVQVNGRSYVDLEALARVANGSLGFKGNQITLTLPGSGSPPPASAPAPSNSAPQNPGLSKGFLSAGIEAMSVVREWHSALANAIQNGFPLADSWLAGYRAQATTALRLASVAVSTDSDRNAYQLLSNGFNMMTKLSNQYVDARQSLSYISPDALQNDPLNQRLVNCGHSLAAMVANGQFQDDGSCQ
jgi:hypothetical protein